MARGLKPFYPAFKQKYSHTQSSPCCFFEAATSVPSAPWCQVSCPTRPERVNLNLFEEKNPIKPKKSLIIFALRLCSLVHHTIKRSLECFLHHKKTYSTTQYGTLVFFSEFSYSPCSWNYSRLHTSVISVPAWKHNVWSKQVWADLGQWHSGRKTLSDLCSCILFCVYNQSVYLQVCAT